MMYTEAQQHFNDTERSKDWITSLVAVPDDNLYQRLFELSKQYGMIKAEFYVDVSSTDNIYVKCVNATLQMNRKKPALECRQFHEYI